MTSKDEVQARLDALEAHLGAIRVPAPPPARDADRMIAQARLRLLAEALRVQERRGDADS